LPEAALEKFMAHPDEFDLVVSDMAMPALSGLELAERMLAVPAAIARSSSPVVFSMRRLLSVRRRLACGRRS